MAFLLGLAVAASYGAADFLGGLSARRSDAGAVVIVSQATSLAVLAVLLVLDPGDGPRGADLGLGAIAGIVGCIGLLLLYRGLASGRMGIIAPVTAVGSAVVPFAWGVLTGERPAPVALAGVAVALLAVALIASSSAPQPPPEQPATADGAGQHGRRDLVLAATSGTCFGVVFILLGNTSSASGFWPLAAARPASVALLTGLALARRQPLLPRRADAATVMGAGLLDVTANALFLLAVRRGLLSLVAVLGSLYPASTVLLARLVLGERFSARQVAGLALALAGVALIAAG